LAGLRHGGVKASEQEIIAALDGDYRVEHLFTLRQSLESEDAAIAAPYERGTLIGFCACGIVRAATSSGSRPLRQWCWSLSPMESMVPGFVRHPMVTA